MTTQTEALKLALDALDDLSRYADLCELLLKETHPAKAFALRERVTNSIKTITAIKEALAQPEQGPVACPDCKRLEDELERANIKATVWKSAYDVEVGCNDQEKERCVGCEACIDTACGRDECPKGWPKALQPEQEPVAIKFKIYKPTVPDPMRQDINDALLPWVYDQSRGSGFVASMWVTPVSTLPPQRKPLTDEEIGAILEGVNAYGTRLYTFARAIEAAHGIKE